MTVENATSTYFRSSYVSVASVPRNGDEETAGAGVGSTAFSDLLQGSNGARAAGGPEGIPEGVLPVEMYAIPNWYADYGFQVPNQLGGGNWFAECYPEAAAASQSERDEYSGLVRKHYDALLDDNGIHDTTTP